MIPEVAKEETARSSFYACFVDKTKNFNKTFLIQEHNDHGPNPLIEDNSDSNSNSRKRSPDISKTEATPVRILNKSSNPAIHNVSTAQNTRKKRFGSLFNEDETTKKDTTNSTIHYKQRDSLFNQ